MNKNVRWKLIVIVGVVALAIWAFYPPQQKVNLGLDLKGGVHLVMRVRTDEALKIETDTTVERLRETLSRAGVQYMGLEVTSPTEFVATGVQNPQAFRQAAAEVEQVLALLGPLPGGRRFWICAAASGGTRSSWPGGAFA